MKTYNIDKQLVQAHLELLRSVKQEMRPTSGIVNLTLVQLNVLIFLHENKRALVSDIAGYFGIAIPSGTVLVDRLVALKLVERRPDVEDRRKIRISLTQRGKKLLVEAMKEREFMAKRLFSRLTLKDKSDFLRIIKHIIQN